jgi:hypothetical protein
MTNNRGYEMSSEVKRKISFGSVTVDHVSPELGTDAPKAFNIHLSFEEALKLHLGLGQVLAHLNGYNRSTKAGRRSGANLCLYTQKLRITINERRVRKKAAGDAVPPETEPTPTWMQRVFSSAQRNQSSSNYSPQMHRDTEKTNRDNELRRIFGQRRTSIVYFNY